MRRSILAGAVILAAGIAQAKDVYIYELLKQPTYARAWTSLLGSSKGVPAWLRNENGYIANPAKTVAIDSVDHSVSVIAKQHATNAGQAAILFAPDGSRAWAAIEEEGRPKRLLGDPSPAQRAALDKALAE